jgi:hypothetical protein
MIVLNVGGCELNQGLLSKIRGSKCCHLLTGISPNVLSFAGSAEKIVTKQLKGPKLLKG